MDLHPTLRDNTAEYYQSGWYAAERLHRDGLTPQPLGRHVQRMVAYRIGYESAAMALGHR